MENANAGSHESSGIVDIKPDFYTDIQALYCSVSTGYVMSYNDY
jgi:hypothetical protein